MIHLPFRWILVGISFINIAVAHGLNFSFSIFYVAILEEFHWSRSSLAAAFSLSTLILGIGSWPMGKLVDRLGPKKILIGGSVLLSLSTLACGWIQEIWHLYLLLGLLAALGNCSLGGVTHSVLISNWFTRNRGMAIGITFAGMGIGILVLSLIAQQLISRWGWRAAYMLLGLAALALLIPLNCLQRNRPDQSEGPAPEPSPRPKEISSRPPEGTDRGRWSGEPHTLGNSVRTSFFWALFFAYLLVPLGNFPVAVHQVAYLTDLGVSKISASLVFGMIGLLSSAGRFLFGTFSDRVGRERAAILSFVFTITGVVILLLLPALPWAGWLFLYALFFGLSFGARGPIITAMVADAYAGRNFGSIYGFLHLGNGAGGALGAWLGGYIFDLTGSYRTSFLICIPILVSAGFLFCLAGRLAGKRDGFAGSQ